MNMRGLLSLIICLLLAVTSLAVPTYSEAQPAPVAAAHSDPTKSEDTGTHPAHNTDSVTEEAGASGTDSVIEDTGASNTDSVTDETADSNPQYNQAAGDIRQDSPASESVSNSSTTDQLDKTRTPNTDAEAVLQERVGAGDSIYGVKDEVDWGHGGVKNMEVEDPDDNRLRQQEQEEEQVSHREQEKNKRLSQEESQSPLSQEESQSSKSQKPEKQQEERAGDRHADPATDQVGVVQPEHFMHGDSDVHHGSSEQSINPEEAEAERVRQAAAKQQSELDELRAVQPNLPPSNVHDGSARLAAEAEFRKRQQFGHLDVEEVIHGGRRHVHDEGLPAGQDQAGNVEELLHGEAGLHDQDRLEFEKEPQALDPEELMHADQGEHPPHHGQETKEIGAENPGHSMVLPENHQASKTQKPATDTEFQNSDIESLIHEGQHVHQHTGDRGPSKNKVRYQDIIELGLSPELLKGIDLSKLLEQEKAELADWHQQTLPQEEVSPDSSDTKLINSWKWTTEFRRTYLAKLYSRVRHISKPDLENAEWEKDDDVIRGHKGSRLHEDESAVEHEMEMWASTIAKGDRKPYKVMQSRWAKTSEEGGPSSHAQHQESNQEDKMKLKDKENVQTGEDSTARGEAQQIDDLTNPLDDSSVPPGNDL